jgi:tRNA threonylcarbamoyladenosine biosynthesis protein TsaB
LKLIGWDTSSKAGALVAFEWHEEEKKLQLVTEWNLNVSAVHSERLLWGIHQLLESAGWQLSEVDAFGVGVGPGSFTGLRIGLTTVRTLAHSFKKPILEVSSLAVLARPAAHFASELEKPVLIVAATDASKGEVFAVWGQAVPGNEYFFAEEEALSPSELALKLEKVFQGLGSEAHWVALGEGVDRYPEATAGLPQERKKKLAMLHPNLIQGRYLGELMKEQIEKKQYVNALDAFPRYLRASAAEIKLEKTKKPDL